MNESAIKRGRKRKNSNEKYRLRDGEKTREKRKDLKIIIMSWPDRFGFPIFKSADWEMRERQKETEAG